MARPFNLEVHESAEYLLRANEPASSCISTSRTNLQWHSNQGRVAYYLV